MGYVGSKIPGHSGTAQKHKKAFSRRNQWVRNRLHTESTKREQAPLSGKYSSSYQEGAIYRKLKVLIGLPVLFIVCAMSWWMFSTIGSSLIKEEQNVGIRIPGITKEQTHAFRILIKGGKRASSAGNYKLAFEEYNRALKYVPYDKQARLGLLKAMTQLCSETQKYCEVVEEQHDFVVRMGWLEE